MTRPLSGPAALALPALLLLVALGVRVAAGTPETDPPRALAAQLSRADALDPDDALDRAAERLGADDLESAAEWLEALLVQRPDEARALHLLGFARHLQGRFAEAARLHERAARDGGFAASSTYGAACARARLGEREPALDALERALLLGFANLALVDADRDLDALRDEPRFRALRETLAASGTRAGRTVLELRGDEPGALFGFELAALPDVDGDGVPELCVGAPFASDAGAACGRVRVCSGRTGRALWSRAGRPGARLGHALAALDDVDGDGLPDLAAGAPGDADGRGAALVLSGRDGRVLRELRGDAAGEAFGSALAALVDCDGDGTRELAVGAPSHDAGRGRVAIRATRDGRALCELPGELAGDGFGAALAAARDDALLAVTARDAGLAGRGRVEVLGGWPPARRFVVDGGSCDDGGAGALDLSRDFDRDGVPDLVASGAGCARARGDHDARDEPCGADRPRVTVRSGRDGHELLVLAGRPDAGFANCARGVDDLDGDGVPELLVGSWLDASGGPRAGRVLLVSGRDGAPRLALSGEAGETFGFAFAPLGDVDGDGRPEVAVASACWGGDAGPATGRVGLLSLGLAFDGTSGAAR